MLNTKISNNLEPSVLALVSIAPRTEAELIAELKGESPYVTDHDILISAVRLAHRGLIRQKEATGAWELNTGRNETRPVWAEHTEYDMHGQPTVYTTLLVDSERVTISLVQEGDAAPMLQMVELATGSGVDFGSAQTAFDTADDLRKAADRWQLVQIPPLTPVPSLDGEDPLPDCPRCGEAIQLAPDGSPFAAMSRATAERDIEICATCGSDEALRQAYEGLVIATDEWPVTDPHRFSQQMVAVESTDGPAWAEKTELDVDGTPLLHFKNVLRNDRMEATLVQEVEPDVQKMLCQVGGDSWVDFNSPEHMLDFIDDLKITAGKWQRIRAGEQL